MSTSPAPNGALDTFPKLLDHNARVRGGRPAAREKMYGIWQTWTWSELREEARALAMGLMGLGLQPGERVAIVGKNRPQLYWSIVSCQMCGAVPVPAGRVAPTAAATPAALRGRGLRLVYRR